MNEIDGINHKCFSNRFEDLWSSADTDNKKFIFESERTNLKLFDIENVQNEFLIEMFIVFLSLSSQCLTSNCFRMILKVLEKNI